VKNTVRDANGRSERSKIAELKTTSNDYQVNQAWLDAAMTACILLSWQKLTVL
jgi:hypothetical protein